MTKQILRSLILCLLPIWFPGTALEISAADQPQWGEPLSRNMVSRETGLPDRFDPESGLNLRWSIPLGTKCYSTPVVAEGKILVGTNNDRGADPRHRGDRGVLRCFDETDGRICWQLVVPKLSDDRYKDWPKIGMVSPATVEKGRVYTVTNRAEVVCLDLNGLADGNDGPFRDEALHMVPEGDPPLELGTLDADIIWLFDMRSEVGMYPHDGVHASVLIHGDFLYLNTANGVDNTHRKIRQPDAPSLIVLDKKTGRLVAQDNERIGPRIFHCAWSSPSIGNVNGRETVFYGGGDGICYAFGAVSSPVQAGDAMRTLERIWRFDCDPTAPKENVHEYIKNREVSPSVIYGMPVYHGERVYLTAGGDFWWGKKQSWLKCIDATGTGDLSDSGEIWSYPLVSSSFSTPSVADGMVFVADCSGMVHCVDARTGSTVWTHQTDGAIWGSTMVADGKVYVGTRRKRLWVLAAERDKEVISSVQLDSQISGTPTMANSTLYLATMRKLYAFRFDAQQSR